MSQTCFKASFCICLLVCVYRHYMGSKGGNIKSYTLTEGWNWLNWSLQTTAYFFPPSWEGYSLSCPDFSWTRGLKQCSLASACTQLGQQIYMWPCPVILSTFVWGFYFYIFETVLLCSSSWTGIHCVHTPGWPQICKNLSHTPEFWVKAVSLKNKQIELYLGSLGVAYW